VVNILKNTTCERNTKHREADGHQSRAQTNTVWGVKWTGAFVTTVTNLTTQGSPVPGMWLIFAVRIGNTDITRSSARHTSRRCQCLSVYREATENRSASLCIVRPQRTAVPQCVSWGHGEQQCLSVYREATENSKWTIYTTQQFLFCIFQQVPIT
jgi:hypothetical protein